MIQRGTNRCDLFRGAADYAIFRATLYEACRRYGVDVHAYAFMTNHVHLVATPRAPGALSSAMQAVGRRYVKYFNEQHARVGALFQGRLRSTIIDSGAYWFTCARYVELNPVRAGLARSPRDYRWSSYAAHACGSPDSLITLHPLYLALGRTPKARQSCWREMCAEELQQDQLEIIRRAFHRGGTLGNVVLADDRADETGQP